jgi:hypothetical protein
MCSPIVWAAANEMEKAAEDAVKGPARNATGRANFMLLSASEIQPFTFVSEPFKLRL